MARFRRKTCIALSLFTIFIFGTMMGLKTLKAADGLGDPGPGLQRLAPAERVDSRRPISAKAILMLPPTVTRANAARLAGYPPANRDLHIFYYAWYGNPRADGRFAHWDHPLVPHWDPKVAASYPRGRHSPPEDIGSSFYPELGTYSSRDPQVIEEHMRQLRSAAVGVLVLSWYPSGLEDENSERMDDLVPAILDAADKYSLKVAFHIMPYMGRNDHSVSENIKYIVDKYGSHSAFYKYRTSTGRLLPMFYIYDSYLTLPASWANLLTSSGSHSIRNTPYDGVFIGLIVEEKHKQDILESGFDGLYTYFASNGFSFGSSHQNWKTVKNFCDSNNLMFIPSVGPGYIDTRIRPWNNHNTRNRVSGKYYETALHAALTVRPEIISITSFNEWHEGTQIEKAVPKKTAQYTYLDYLPHEPNLYLELTHKWAEHFCKEKEQWLM
ncbi:glycoprotein endo-alpha-1,2-mannosidase-like protein [Scyliorhinus canicula]|uniref:glycoprotein endo-alpha-1,2-mannosidase-like protein n=1 Tax=Scyliorhinus canicula TaxID=7830 RepID=UPI0018F36291|nr:glycoprotein endo-alpha-1,2-mannosidase-like protein [Scyliorhinus canicula]